MHESYYTNTNPEVYESEDMYPEGYADALDAFDRNAAHSMESFALLGANVVTLAFANVEVAPNPKREAMRRAFGEFHAETALRNEVTVNLLSIPKAPLDAKAFAEHQNAIYGSEDYAPAI